MQRASIVFPAPGGPRAGYQDDPVAPRTAAEWLETEGVLMVTEKQAKAALARLQKGKTTLIAESRRLGFTHNQQLRAALRRLIGREGYDALIEKACPKRPPCAALRTNKSRCARPARMGESMCEIHSPTSVSMETAFLAAPTVDPELQCPLCSGEIKAAYTNGFGQIVLTCSCGWTEPVRQMQSASR